MAKKKAVKVKKETMVSKKGLLLGRPSCPGNSDAWVDINKKTNQAFAYNGSNGVATVKVTVNPRGQNASTPVEVANFDFSDLTCRATFSSGTYEGNLTSWIISDDSPPKKKLFTFEFQFPPGLSFSSAVADPAELVVTVLTKKSITL